MTQSAKPVVREWKSPPELIWYPGGEKGTVWIECETFHPKSGVGKTVMVYFDIEAVTAALLLLRDRAIEARR